MSSADASPPLPQRVRIDENVAWQKVEGLVVMIGFTNDHYYRLDETGSRMWELLDECPDVSSAFARLREEFDVDDATLRRDLQEFIARLADAGLLEVTPART